MNGGGGGSIVVAGAGPHGLTACAYLAEADPSVADRLVVVDPRGWLEQWERKLAALDIRWLRSSCVHHPHPHPFSLIEVAGEDSAELRGPYRIPSRRLFAQFCGELRERIGLDERRLVRDRLVALQPRAGGVLVRLAGGDALEAERVVMATDPRRPRIPAVAAAALREAPAGTIAHASDVDLGASCLAGRRVAIVGGGLTAVQLAVGAAERGAHPTLLARRRLRARTFDVTPGWMTYKLEAFLAVDGPARRRPAVAAARGRGTVPADELKGLAALARRGRVQVCERTTVEEVIVGGAGVVLRTGAGCMEFDRLWLATGSRPDALAEPALRGLQESHPAPWVGALPALDAHCRWPGTQVHLMGELSSLQTGPMAPNLAGARIAAERIAAAAGRAPWQYPQPAPLRPLAMGPAPG